MTKRIIRVSVWRKHDWYVATSADLLGLFVANPDIRKVMEDVPVTIKALLKAQHGIEVEVSEASYMDKTEMSDMPWIATPIGSDMQPVAAHA